MPNGGKLDQEIWERFDGNWDDLFFAKEQARARIQEKSLEELLETEQVGENRFSFEIPEEGLTREALVRIRVNQHAFRKHILSIYKSSCCMTGLSEPGLLTASHIVPWSQDVTNRMNPQNGLCLNALHDRAFDRHYITVSAENYRIQVSRRFSGPDVSEAMRENFISIAGRQISLPETNQPDRSFLRSHNERFMRVERGLTGLSRD
jgi:putative restriction endonuclease